MHEEDMGKRLGLGGVHRQQLLWSVLDPLLKILPKSKPAVMELVARAVILCTQLNKPGAIGDQLTCLGAKIDSIVSMHIWGLSSSKKLSGVIFMAARSQPLARTKEGALRAVRDESTAQVYTAISNNADKKHSNNSYPFARSTKRSLVVDHC